MRGSMFAPCRKDFWPSRVLARPAASRPPSLTNFLTAPIMSGVPRLNSEAAEAGLMPDTEASALAKPFVLSPPRRLESRPEPTDCIAPAPPAPPIRLVMLPSERVSRFSPCTILNRSPAPCGVEALVIMPPSSAGTIEPTADWIPESLSPSILPASPINCLPMPLFKSSRILMDMMVLSASGFWTSAPYRAVDERAIRTANFLMSSVGC